MMLKQLAGMAAIAGAIVVALSLVTGATWAPNMFGGAGESAPERGKSPLYWPIVAAWTALSLFGGIALAGLSLIPNSN